MDDTARNEDDNCTLCLNEIPLEILYLVAQVDELTYRAMLSIPRFARSVTIGKILEFMELFGHNVRIEGSAKWKRIVWSRYCMLHRMNGPAVSHLNGRQEWYQNGKRHRLNGPAVIGKNGIQEWYFDDKLHREDGPALIFPDGTLKWYINDKLHRLDGPAIISPEGDQYWYLDGKRHRIDEPAIIFYNGEKQWYHDGVLLKHCASNGAILQCRDLI